MPPVCLVVLGRQVPGHVIGPSLVAGVRRVGDAMGEHEDAQGSTPADLYPGPGLRPGQGGDGRRGDGAVHPAHRAHGG